MLKVPFSFFPKQVVLGLAHYFKNAGGFFSSFFPQLHENLIQAGISETPREYVAIALSVSLTNAVGMLAAIIVISALAGLDLAVPALGFFILILIASFLTVIFYPKIIMMRIRKLQENQLIPAVRQLLIELRSGVPLFNAMTSISTGYGEVSVQFRKIINNVNSGFSELDALSEAARETPSQQFRKVLWQIQNALKVGSDVGDSLESLLGELTKEKIDEIHRYGQELSPWTMFYMMAAVVLPSLGMTMIIVISSFLSVSIPSIILPLVLMLVVGFQVFFMSFVSSRRPLI
ncbi:MAG TPA: type II secretion system F family protein [Candidatus Norongarragalinales archaeon]|nr:type II secretion system F family protein [Candidatus Norongarragalinales archaeon]